MQIDGYVQALREDLARVAAVGDESTARAAELLAVALESAIGRRLLEALGEAALELNGQLDDGQSKSASPAATPSSSRPRGGSAAEPADEAFTARITLRLPESLKQRLEAAATREAPPSTRGSSRRSSARSSRAVHRRRRKPPPPHRLRPELKGARDVPRLTDVLKLPEPLRSDRRQLPSRQRDPAARQARLTRRSD